MDALYFLSDLRSTVVSTTVTCHDLVGNSSLHCTVNQLYREGETEQGSRARGMASYQDSEEKFG